VPGCSAQWTAATSTVDKSFEMRIERFYRLKANSMPDERYDATEVLDDDEGYTQL
jgi:hypothetical protein